MSDLRVGGITEEKPADNDVQLIADKVKSDVEKQSGRAFSEFVAKSYCTQVVAGINYFIKVRVDEGSNNYILIRVYKHFDTTITLSAFQLDIKESDPIVYF